MVAAAVSAVTFGSVTSAGAATSPAPNACSLLSAQDLQAALGGTVADGNLTTATDGTQTLCDWVITVSSSRGYGAQLSVSSGQSAADFATQRKIARGRTRTIKHLGDSAFSERAVEAGQVYDDLWARHGTIAFRVEVLKDLGSKPLEPLARLVLARL